jgi:hypothetical protein
MTQKVAVAMKRSLNSFCNPILFEEHRLRLFENRELKRIFGPKRDKGRENGENCIMRSFVICTLRQV